MIRNYKSISIFFGIALLAVIFISAEIEARGGRGGGRGGGGKSFSRGGTASRGGFSSRSSRQSGSRKQSRTVSKGSQERRNKTSDTRQSSQGDNRGSQEDRQEWKDKNREDIQDSRRGLQDDRQDFIEDAHDDYWDDRNSFYVGAAVGASAVRTATYITTLPCTTTAIVVNGVSYYSCTSTWYKRSYSGSQVTYITVAAPSGY
jgi:hypothetical protein